MVYPAFAVEYDLNSYHADDDSNESSEYSQIVSTSDGTIDVGIYTIPAMPNTEEPTKIHIHFLKPDHLSLPEGKKIQVHIDYTVSITKDGNYVFGPMSRLWHISPGFITIPVEFTENGSYIMNVDVFGVYFNPFTKEHKTCTVGKVYGCETTSFTINVGQAETSIPSWIKNNAGWWADGQIDDGSFVSGLQWLISNGIMKIS